MEVAQHRCHMASENTVAHVSEMGITAMEEYPYIPATLPWSPPGPGVRGSNIHSLESVARGMCQCKGAGAGGRGKRTGVCAGVRASTCVRGCRRLPGGGGGGGGRRAGTWNVTPK